MSPRINQWPPVSLWGGVGGWGLGGRNHQGDAGLFDVMHEPVTAAVVNEDQSVC